MNKLLFLLLSFALWKPGFSQLVPVSDPAFLNFLQTNYPNCVVDQGAGNWQLNTTCPDVVNEDSITIIGPGMGTGSSYDLSLLPYFVNLRFLHIREMTVSALPASLPDNLIKFIYTSIDAPGVMPLNNRLRYLDTHENLSMGAITTLPDSLRYYNCVNNGMSSLPPLPSFLDTLICAGQYINSDQNHILTSLPALPATLKYLDCSQNALTALPNLPNGLIHLNCLLQRKLAGPFLLEMTLGALPVLPASLEFLNASHNKLSVVPALPAALKYLDVSATRFFENDLTTGNSGLVIHEGISQLPDLPPTLEYLLCKWNNLTSLPQLPPTLKLLDASENVRVHGQGTPDVLPITAGITHVTLHEGLEYLNVAHTPISCLPRIPNSLEVLVTTGSFIACLPNSANYTSPDSLALCNVVNNKFKCNYSPVISGVLFYDNNQNGAKDANENFRPNVEVQSSAGFSAYSNLNGYFEITGDTGLNTITVIPPLPYNSIPPAINYTFSGPDTMVYDEYALQATITHDSLRVTIIDEDIPRPGFAMRYTVGYENIGTTVINTNMQLLFDAANLNYENASVAGVVAGSGTLTFPPMTLTPGNAGSIALTFVVNTAAPLGDTLLTSVSATVNAGWAKDSVFSEIRGSFDPNDKNATPLLTPAQVAGGDFINYLVRFQNTGTDTAFNVVVTDTLDARLNASSFQMLEASHPAIIKREGVMLSFEFLNINLPDSNVNEPLSHGYIKFRVKPVATLVDGDEVHNKTSIYFDYNAPVVTNTAVTKVVAPVSCFTLSSSSTPATCPGANNGSITVTVSGGTGPFTYALNGMPPQTSATIVGVAAGLNSVVVTDANGCSDSIAVTVAAGFGFTASAASVNATCGQSDGGIIVTVSGGTSPYFYSLDNGPQQSSGTFNAVTSGFHTITITDANGCTGSVATIVGETPISATITVTQPACVVQGSILVTSPTGFAPFLYSVNGGTLQSSAMFDNLPAGSYTVLVQDANLCTYTETVTINASPGTVTPSVSITASASTICQGDPVTFTATATNGGANPQYQWTVNGSSAGSNTATLTINPTADANVSVQLISDDPCASPTTAASNVVIVTVGAAQTPTVTISGTTTITPGSSTTITSSITNGGTTPSYQWQDSTTTHTWADIAGATNSSIDYTPQQSGDGIRAVLTSTATCVSVSEVTSNALYFTLESTTVPRPRLYPNPVRSILTIENNAQTPWVSADIFDENGRKVMTFLNTNAAGDVRINVSKLISGVYFIKLTDRNGNPEYFKFVKQ